MTKNNHYYSNSIKEKCNELQDIHDDLNRKFEERKHNLDKSTEVHESLQQVSVYTKYNCNLTTTVYSKVRIKQKMSVFELFCMRH